MASRNSKKVKRTRTYAALAVPAPVHLIPVPQQQQPPRRSLFQELTSNDLRAWLPAPRCLANPDDLVGRRGMRVYSEMRLDDQVWAALKLKKHAVLSTGWDIKPPDDPTPEEEQAAKFAKWALEEGLDGSLDDDLLECLTASDFGVSITELCWRPVLDGEWKGRIGLWKLATRRPNDFFFRVDTHDNLLPEGIEQFGKPHPRDRFVLYSVNKEFDNHYGQSDLRAAYRAWWMKDNVLRWWGIFLDRYSIPIAIGKYDPNNPSVSGGDITDLQTALDRLQSATSMTFPNYVTLEFPTVGTAQGSQIFAMAVQEQNMAIARALLLPNLLGVSAQGDTGSYSQARKHFDVFILIVEKQQRDLAEIVMGEQVIKPLVRLNFDVQRYPVFYFLPFTETDKGQLLGMFNQAIAAGVVRARPPDEIHVRSMTEFPEVPLEDIEAEVEAAKAAEAGGGGGGGGFGGGGAPGPGGGRTEEIPPGGGGAEGEMTDEELDALIEEALGGEGGAAAAGEGKVPTDEELDAAVREEHPEWDDEQVAAEVAKRKGGAKAFAAAQPQPKVERAVREAHPDWTAEQVAAEVTRLLAGGRGKGAKEGELSDEELDALIEEVLGEAKGGEENAVREGEGADAGAAEVAEEEGAVAEGPAGVLEPTDEEVAAGIMTEHPDWDEAAVKTAVEEWRTARKRSPQEGA